MPGRRRAPRRLTTSEAAAYLKISESTFRRQVLPHIPVHKLSRHLIRFDPKDLDQWHARRDHGSR